MPLKKPTDIPKIPKTRKKKAQAAIEAIPLKKPDKLEYYCKASFQYDPVIDEQFCVFAIETVAEFTNFSYSISVDFFREKNEIYIVLMGLKANTNMVPKVQPARSEVAFENLFGEYTVNVVKQDGSMNAGVYKFNLYNKEILLLDQYKVKKKNNRLFCEFSIEEDNFSFAD